jgi:hypothetical protein
MTALSTHPLDDPDQLALIADDWTSLAIDLADAFRDACYAEATEHDGWVNPCSVTARLKARDPEVNMRRVSALWSTACGRDGYLNRSDRLVQIDGSVSRGNGNKSVALRYWRGWVQ